jgi:hypothetical protein
LRRVQIPPKAPFLKTIPCDGLLLYLNNKNKKGKERKEKRRGF